MIEPNGTKHDICKLEVFGQSKDATEERYLLGNKFLKGYYIALNYTGEGSIGFNGPYNLINIYIEPKPHIPPGISPMFVILVIGGVLLFVSVGICVCIKKKNEQLQQQLQEQTSGGQLDY